MEESAIPTELGQIPMMKGFDASGNDLTGTIPSEFGLLGNLTTFNVAMNDLTGADRNRATVRQCFLGTAQHQQYLLVGDSPSGIGLNGLLGVRLRLFSSFVRMLLPLHLLTSVYIAAV